MLQELRTWYVKYRYNSLLSQMSDKMSPEFKLKLNKARAKYIQIRDI